MKIELLSPVVPFVRVGHIIIIVHCVLLYRLVCESTVEENILKKANQKRMLGDIAIEGGVFTTDFFKEVHFPKKVFCC